MIEIYGYIYVTINLSNRKMYVGQTTRKGYSLNTYLGSGRILKEAIKKYGRDSFQKRLIDFAYSQEELNQKEIFYIRWLEPEYNLSKGGQYSSNFHVVSSLREKLKDPAFAKDWSEKCRRRWSTTTREDRSSYAKKGWKTKAGEDRKLLQEKIQSKVDQNQKSQKMEIYWRNLSEGERILRKEKCGARVFPRGIKIEIEENGMVFSSISEVCKYLGVDYTCVARAMKDSSKTTKGVHLKVICASTSLSEDPLIPKP